MDYAGRLEISYYNTIANINSAHKIYLVQHRESQKIYVKKILDVYNPYIYKYLMEHPITGIPRLYNVYEENEQLILIEEFISGVSLQEMIDGRTLTFDLIVRFMGELCDILEKLHMLNPPIIHRDIKPSNIIITPYNHVVLIDFNAAKYLTYTAVQDTVLLGTKGYAAPEQYGFGFSTPRTDIYALGVLLKELSLALPVPTSIFDAIIGKCTRINPYERMETVRQVKTKIEKLQARNGDISQQATVSATWKSFIPPGYRTKTPWKMLIASPIYLFIFYLGLSTEATETADMGIFGLLLGRITMLFMMLFIVFCCFNYRNIRRYMPLCASKYRLIRYLGVVTLYYIIVCLMTAGLLLVESLFDFFVSLL